MLRYPGPLGSRYSTLPISGWFHSTLETTVPLALTRLIASWKLSSKDQPHAPPGMIFSVREGSMVKLPAPSHGGSPVNTYGSAPLTSVMRQPVRLAGCATVQDFCVFGLPSATSMDTIDYIDDRKNMYCLQSKVLARLHDALTAECLFI
eukprot:354169-Chlamydomonas_euryale.AAC.6